MGKPIGNDRLGTVDKTEHMLLERSKYADYFCNDRYGTIDACDSEHDLLLGLARTALADASAKAQGEGSLSKPGALDRCGVVSGCLSFPRDQVQGELCKVQV